MRVMNPPTLLMEDHREAYFYWTELGIRDHVCLHVDAHLDVSDLKAPGYEVAQSPEINCGNFLLPALANGIVSSLVWVVPEHLPGEESLLDWLQSELQNWLRLRLTDYQSLESVGRRVEGTLLGKPFTVCFAKDLPAIERPVVLDIDIDYFLAADDSLWQSPQELAAHLRGLRPGAITIAYSVQGGYTPPRYRYLAPLTEIALKAPEQAEELWSALHGGPSVGTESGTLSWVPPALLAIEGRLDEAAELEPGYLTQAVDKVSAALMRDQLEQAESHLQNVECPREASFMRGMIALKRRDFALVVKCWGKLLDTEQLGTDTQVYLLTNCGRAYLQSGLFKEARRCLKKAAHLSRNDPEILALLARAENGDGKPEEAAKLFRRSVKLAPALLETGEVRLELAELYLKRGQRGLAERLIRQTLVSESPAFMKLRAEALQMKLALSTQVELGAEE